MQCCCVPSTTEPFPPAPFSTFFTFNFVRPKSLNADNMTTLQQGTLLDVLKKKMRQTKEEMEKYKDECEDYQKRLQGEVIRREEVSWFAPKTAINVYVVQFSWSPPPVSLSLSLFHQNHRLLLHIRLGYSCWLGGAAPVCIRAMETRPREGNQINRPFIMLAPHQAISATCSRGSLSAFHLWVYLSRPSAVDSIA